jgi:hypothetical protein
MMNSFLFLYSSFQRIVNLFSTVQINHDVYWNLVVQQFRGESESPSKKTEVCNGM